MLYFHFSVHTYVNWTYPPAILNEDFIPYSLLSEYYSHVFQCSSWVFLKIFTRLEHWTVRMTGGEVQVHVKLVKYIHYYILCDSEENIGSDIPCCSSEKSEHFLLVLSSWSNLGTYLIVYVLQKSSPFRYNVYTIHTF